MKSNNRMNFDLQARVEGNCGRAIDRGEEARECAVKLTPRRGIFLWKVRLANLRRQPHFQRNCEVTNRNHIQGRDGQASVPCNAKPSSLNRSGKCGTCAVKHQNLIKGDLPDVSETNQACLQWERLRANVGVSSRSQQRA